MSNEPRREVKYVLSKDKRVATVKNNEVLLSSEIFDDPSVSSLSKGICITLVSIDINNQGMTAQEIADVLEEHTTRAITNAMQDLLERKLVIVV